MSVPPPEALRAIADALYGWRGRERIGAKDVVVWVRASKAEYGRYGIAFQGDALRMTRYALSGSLDNHQSSLDLSLQRALGLPAETRRGASGMWPVRQTMSDGDAHISEVLDGVEQLTSELLGGESLVEVTLMPSQGAPYSSHNSPTPYYSAKTGRVVTTKRPPWLVAVETSEGSAVGADFCAFAPRISHCVSGSVVGSFVGDPSRRFIVSHCSAVFDRVGGSTPAATAKLIRSCGGLLFPSVAVGEVPATNFGELVLVADPSLILPALKPYKKRGAWPVIVYETDVWTETTRHFLGDGAVELLGELTDVSDFMYKSHFWVLGPPVRDAQARPLSSTKQLRTKLKQRARRYRRELDKSQMDAVRFAAGEGAEKYAYLEAKVNGVTAMDCYPLAVCPKGETRRVRSFLKGIGFAGDLITVERPAEVEGRDQRWDYAWRVRDAVLAYAERDPQQLVLSLEE